MKESFNELYTRLYKQNFEELESLRSKEKNTSVLIIFVIATAFILSTINPIFIIFVILGLVACIISFFKRVKYGRQSGNREKTYSELFKEKIVGPIVEHVFHDSKYEPENGLARLDYVKAGYKDDIDRYFSEDLIIAPLRVNNESTTLIKFAEVHTQKENRDSDGNTNYITQFHGLAGSFNIPQNMKSKIYIRSNWSVSNLNKNKVKMDMSEFEKLFDVESEDAILAMRILTADVMAEMIDLYKKYKYKFEISIIDDAVYMRLSTGSMFEPNIFKNSMEYKQVEKYYLVLKALMEIANHIYETILKIEL